MRMEAQRDGLLVINKTPPAWEKSRATKMKCMEQTKDNLRDPKFLKKYFLKPPQPFLP